MWRYNLINRTTLISSLCGGVLCGIALSGSGFSVSALWLLIVIPISPIALKRGLVSIPLLVVAGVLIGSVRGADVSQEFRVYQNYIEKNIVLQGTVSEDPRKGSRNDTIIVLQNVSVEGGPMLPGEVRISMQDDRGLQRGDSVKVDGKLKSGFGVYQATMSYAELKGVSKANDLILDVRNHFSKQVREVLDEPQASLALGFVIGENAHLPDELNDQMKLVGLTHVVVASGYNLTILVRAARRLFVRYSKYMTVAAALALTFTFLLVTGFSPSMVRAALITTIALLAWYYGRTVHPVTLILFAASLTAYINPVYTWADVGWYLSFSAFAGVMLLAPAIKNRLLGQRDSTISQIVVETCSAQLATLPVILFMFGSLPLLSLVANVAVVPFVPIAMLTTVLVAALSFIPVMSDLFALVTNGIIGYMVKTIDWLGNLPVTTLDIELGMPGLIICIGLLIGLYYLLIARSRYRYEQGSIID